MPGIDLADIPFDVNACGAPVIEDDLPGDVGRCVDCRHALDVPEYPRPGCSERPVPMDRTGREVHYCDAYAPAAEFGNRMRQKGKHA